ncbi:MAG: HPF/RaiA family ribosome-associated protein, partial [Burkholderiaceae bacterium]|nr:HPF/RaiA family ribosome-associated protein [Burkholderiaceae bacterium]
SAFVLVVPVRVIRWEKGYDNYSAAGGFRDQITRIEVHLSDASATRVGDHDKRCKLEARLAGRQPVLVSHDAANVADSLHGAAEKLLRAVDSTLGKLRDAHGRETIRGADSGGEA